MNQVDVELNKAYFQWLAELNRLQGPHIDEPDNGLTLDSLINFLRGAQK